MKALASLGRLGLVLACGAGLFFGCLNPRPEDFPSSAENAPGNVANDPDEDDVSPPETPSHEEPAPGPDVGAPDAGAPVDGGAADGGSGGGAAVASDAVGGGDAGCSPDAAE